MLAFCISLAITIYLFFMIFVDLMGCYANMNRGVSYTCNAFWFICFSCSTAWTVYAWLLFQFPVLD